MIIIIKVEIAVSEYFTSKRTDFESNMRTLVFGMDSFRTARFGKPKLVMRRIFLIQTSNNKSHAKNYNSKKTTNRWLSASGDFKFKPITKKIFIEKKTIKINIEISV